MKARGLFFTCIVAVLLICLAAPIIGAQSPAKKLRISYIRASNEPYYKFGFDGAKMLADKLGVELFPYISDYKPERELAAIEDSITQKVDGILLVSISRTSIISSVNTAYNAKIPLMLCTGDSQDLRDKTVGSILVDEKLAGGTIGKWVAQNIPEGKVVCITGFPGRGDAETFRDSFVNEMKKNPKLQFVASLPGDYNRQKAFNQMQNLIVSYPDLKVAFVQNEDMALGAIQALKEAGKLDQVTVVSNNGAPYGLEAMAAGQIKATCGWSPSQEAQIALRLLVEYIKGNRTNPKLTVTPLTVITKSTLNAATPWVPTEESTAATLKLDIMKLQHSFIE
jgi:ribose transport system substrate-binding protein